MTEFILLILALLGIRYVLLLSPLRKPLLFVTGLIGAPVHELAHYAACKLNGFEVVNMKLFQMPTPSDGRMGYVEFARPLTVLGALGSVLVGIAPLIMGIAIFVGVSQIDIYSTLSSELIQKRDPFLMIQALISWWSNALIEQKIGLLALGSVALYMTPSWADVKLSIPGLAISLAITLCLFLFVPGTEQIIPFIDDVFKELSTFLIVGVMFSLPVFSVALLSLVITKLIR